MLVHTAIRALGKPQYIFRTSQLLKRAARFVRGTKPFETVTLPWKLRIGVDTADTVGNAIAVQGVYDLVTTEVLWRLTSRGDKTIDGGANVGYMTSILAHRAGRCGSVLAFEPHPQVFQRLKSNVGSWTNVAPITLHNFALSDRSGQASCSMCPLTSKTRVGPTCPVGIIDPSGCAPAFRLSCVVWTSSSTTKSE
jgi:hypothetical protein